MTTTVSFPGLGIKPFTMDRFLIHSEKLSVAWYGAIICVAMILACLLILRFATKKEGFDTDSFLDYFIITIPLGVVGARAMYVLTNLNVYKSFKDAIAVWEGGLAIYGGVLTGILVLFLIAKVKKHNPLAVYDTVVPGVMIAQAIGRWGNFVNGEAHGTVTSLPWGMTIGGEGPFHPTFLYESLWNVLGVCLVIFLLYPKKKFHGEIFFFYLSWYGVGRTFIEGLRTDSLYVGTLRLAQVIGITTALVGAVGMFLFALWRKKGLFSRLLAVTPAVKAKADEAKEAEEETAAVKKASSGKNKSASSEKKKKKK